MRTLGIDVSHYQNQVHWDLVAGSEVKFAFAKATEGSRMVDAQFERNWQHIQDVGLFRGAYHFARPGGDPLAQAVHFASVVGPLGARDMPPVLDLEEDDGHPAQHVLAWARAFVERAESLFGRRIMIYTGQFWRGPLRNPQDAFFGERLLWLAAYRPEPLDIPKSWQRWSFWQFSDGTAHKPTNIQGVTRCDQNWFGGTEQELAEICRAPLASRVGAARVGAAQAEAEHAEQTGTDQAPRTDQTLSPDAVPELGSEQRWPGIYFVWPRRPAFSGGCVRAWQQRMTKLGYALECDGAYGPQCKAVCMAFQREQGLPADGIVGPKTWDAAFSEEA